MQTNAVSVRDYLRMIFRRKWALAAPMLVALLAFFPLWTLTKDTFQAVASVRRDDLAAQKAGPAALISNESPRLDIQAIRAEVLAWQNLDAVMAETKLDRDIKTAAQRQAKYDELRAAIDVRAATQGRGTDIINFSVVLESPDLAQAVANSVASHYVESSKKAQRSGNLSTIDFLQHERDRYHDLLQTTDNELDDYRAKHYADLPEQKNNIRSRLLQLRIEQDTRELQLKDSQSKLEEAAKQLAAVPQTVTMEVTSEQNPVVVDLRNRLSQMQRNLQLMLTTQTEDHPDVISLRQQIAAIKDQVEQEPERVDTSQKQVINPQYRGPADGRLPAQAGGQRLGGRPAPACRRRERQRGRTGRRGQAGEALQRPAAQPGPVRPALQPGPGASWRRPSAAPPCRNRRAPSRSISTPPRCGRPSPTASPWPSWPLPACSPAWGAA